MTAEVEELVEKALGLREQDRDELVDAILGSVEPTDEWLTQWIPIVHDRMERDKAGLSCAIPAEDVFREAREWLSSRRR